MKNQSGMSRITFIILLLIVIVAIYLLVTSGFDKSKTVKEENAVSGQIEITYDSINKNNTQDKE